MIGISSEKKGEDPKNLKRKPANVVMKYMQDFGYKVYPINPFAEGEIVNNEKVLADLKNVPEKKKITDEDIITREENTKSEAIISLLIKRELKGFIFFESASEATFSVDQSTDYLEFFAKITSKHLESLLYK